MEWLPNVTCSSHVKKQLLNKKKLPFRSLLENVEIKIIKIAFKQEYLKHVSFYRGIPVYIIAMIITSRQLQSTNWSTTMKHNNLYSQFCWQMINTSTKVTIQLHYAKFLLFSPAVFSPTQCAITWWLFNGHLQR